MAHLSPNSVLLGAFAMLASFLVAAQTGRADTQCFADWSDAAPIVSREGLRTARDVLGDTRDHLGAEVVRITLCQNQSGFIYRLVLRSSDGRLHNSTVSAVAGGQ
ncbi:MAG: hypothetical protein R3D67_04055 [Hyphomicrobiaceae bacterium]